MSYQKLTPVIAKGTTAPRYLEDRFADVANVKDFGAKGDGTTNDTAAFEAAGATGKTIFVPAGSYIISRRVPGFFVSDGFVEIPYIDVTDVNRKSPLAPWFYTDPVDCGGDFPEIDGQENTQTWGRATQNIFVDPFSMVMYVTVNKGTGETALYALYWSEKASERTFIAWSGWHYDFIGHQGNGIYRIGDKVKIIAKGNPIVGYENDNTVLDYSKTFQVNIVNWDYNNPSVFTKERTFTLFNSSDYDSTTGFMQLCLSSDSKWLVAMAYTSDRSARHVRVWDMAKIMQGNRDNIEGLQKYQFASPYGPWGGQGLACDGHVIFFLSGTTDTIIGMTTLDGHENDEGFRINFLERLDSNAPFFNTTLYPNGVALEMEGLFFAPWYGEMKAFAHLSIQAYRGENDWARYDRFVGFVNKESRRSELSIEQRIADLNNATKPGVYKFASTALNSPNGEAGFLFVFKDSDLLYRIRQVVFQIGIASNIFTRVSNGVVDSVSWNDWMKYDFTYTDSTKSYAKLHSKGSEHGLFLVDQTNSNSVISQINTNGLNTYFDLKTGNLQILGPENNGVDATDNYLRPHITETVSLGTANHVWSSLHIVDGAIEQSDLRCKDNISDDLSSIMKAWGKVRARIFQFKDAISKKGADKARLHIGFVAQEVGEAFASEGLDATKYALFCHDSWDEEWDVKEDGSKIKTCEAGDRYGLRYEEALVLECAYQRWRLEQLEERINQLTNSND